MFYSYSKYFLVLVICTFCCKGFSQSSDDIDEQDSGEFINMLELSGNFAFPLGNFRESMTRIGVGWSLKYLAQMDTKDLALLGVDIQYINLDRLFLSTNSGFLPTDETTGTNVVSASLIYRYYLPYYSESFEPFAQFALGPLVVYTSTSSTIFDGNETTSDFRFDDYSFGVYFNFSAGFNFKLEKNFYVTPTIGYSGTNQLSLLLSEGDTSFEFPIDNFQELSLALNNVNFSIGISYVY